jgi:hypothetical protein
MSYENESKSRHGGLSCLYYDSCSCGVQLEKSLMEAVYIAIVCDCPQCSQDACKSIRALAQKSAFSDWEQSKVPDNQVVNLSSPRKRITALVLQIYYLYHPFHEL